MYTCCTLCFMFLAFTEEQLGWSRTLWTEKLPSSHLLPLFKNFKIKYRISFVLEIERSYFEFSLSFRVKMIDIGASTNR